MNSIKKEFINITKKIKKRLNEISIKRYIKTNKLFITYALVNILFSWYLRIITVENYFSIKALIADTCFVFTFGSLAYLAKPKNQIKVLMPLTIIMMLTCIVNAVYFENYASFASFSMLTTASFLGDMDAGVITSLIQFKDALLIISPIILLIVHILLKKKHYYEVVSLVERGKKRFLNTIIVGISLIITMLTLMSPSDHLKLEKPWNRGYLIEKFGIYVYQLNDAIRSTEPKIISLLGYDNANKITKEFYKNNKKSNTKNEYSNIFEGKNIIVIHAESIMTEDMTLSFNNKELTPNLNRLANEGLFFNNFYSQVSVGTSSDTEFTFNTSLLPSASGTVFVNYWDRTYEAIPNILSKKNYYTASFHANNGTFWNRNVMHEKLGYKDFYDKSTYNVDEENVIGLGLSDEEFFKQSIEKIKTINDTYEKYYLTLITLSNHTPWQDIDKYGDYKVTNGNLDYMENTELGRYFKSVHYADSAIGTFIKLLEKNNLLDNTVLVIYGDHDAKISRKEYKYFYNYDLSTGKQYNEDNERYKEVDYYSYELNRKVPFIIWTKDSKNNKLLNKKIDKVMGMYDAMPTLSNMFNFNYKYGLGHDIFSVKDNIVVFPNGNWLTNDVYYNSQKETYIQVSDKEISSKEIEKNTEYSNKILDVSNSIIMYDLESEVPYEKK